jgi:hypothetical protein
MSLPSSAFIARTTVSGASSVTRRPGLVSGGSERENTTQSIPFIMPRKPPALVTS